MPDAPSCVSVPVPELELSPERAARWLIGSLEILHPGLSLLAERVDDCVRIPLPITANNDFTLVVYIYDRLKECAISAIPLKYGQARPARFFWYLMLESVEFADARHFLEAVLQSLIHLLQAPTRIIQRRHLFLWTFTLEILENDSYRESHSVGCFRRPGLNIPNAGSPETVYHARLLAGPENPANN